MSMPRISRNTIDRIDELDLADFARLLGDPLKKEGRHFFTYRNGGERTPSLCITPEMRLWTAFGSTESGRNAISYYAYRTWDNPKPDGRQFVEAVEAVCHLAGIMIEYEDGQTKQPTGYTGAPRVRIAPPIKPENVKKDNPVLDRYFRRMMGEFPLTNEHANHFLSKRKMNDRQIRARQYRSLPENKQLRYTVASKIVREIGEPDGIPGFAFMKGTQAEYWTIGGRPGILLPFRDIYNHICGFQIRYDKPQVEIIAKGENVRVTGNDTIRVIDDETSEILWEGKQEQLPVHLPDGIEIDAKRRWYGWFASSPMPEKGILKGTSSGDPAPYHCAVPTQILERWKPGQSVKDVMDTSTIWWGEGPIKGDTAADFTEDLHLQVAGVSSWRMLLQPTIELKPKRVVLGFDADAQTKDDSVGKAVLRCVEAAKPILNEHGIELAISIWPEEVGKGLDDCFLKGYKGQIFVL
ncbi:hypothetical protein [Paenibacillus sp. yr247]|uniref:hypothetical protein n=1 Tax=Paenibacillus sp. yr247 TaxID=1761880 RepID=UPI00113FF95C|nr:hypothetical protein [Paenibacillus sp. yr247]